MATMTQERTAEQAFEVGDGATFCGWSDRKAGTIIAASATKITWQRDKAKLMNGAGSGEPDALHFEPGGFCGHTSGEQRWEYERDEDGMIRVFTLRQNGKWIERGGTLRGGARLIAGRAEHYDYNF